VAFFARQGRRRRLWLRRRVRGEYFGVGESISPRNIFLESGYRVLYMDRSHDGFSYNAGEYGLFSGIGVKF
jgi:hypothetical protein